MLNKKLFSSPDGKSIGFLGFISVLARGLYALVPLAIFYRFSTTKETDFYFYWVTQSNLVATFLASAWPAIYVPYLVKQNQNGLQQQELARIAGKLLLTFLPVIFISGAALSLLSWNGLWGSIVLPDKKYFLLLIGVTTITNCLAIILGEISSASRKFGLFYLGQIFAVLGQIAVLFIFDSSTVLIESFLVFCAVQLIAALWLCRNMISFRRPDTLLVSAPKILEIAQIYAGSVCTMLVGHVSYQLLGNYGEGTVSSFAMAQMITALPQQLLINPISTVAGVSMAESASDVTRMKRWRKTLVGSSLFSAAAIALGCCAISEIQLLRPLLSYEIICMSLILTIPLAVSGLNTWVARALMARRAIKLGTSIQISSQVLTLILLVGASYAGSTATEVVSVFAVVAISYFVTIDLVLKRSPRN